LRAKIGIAVLLAILVGSFGLRMAFVHEPFERDEGMYAAVAQVILRGGLPYLDAIDIKPPGVHYLYALAIGALGASVAAVRIFTALYASITLVLVYLTSRRLFGVRAGLLSAALFGVFSTAPRMQASSSNTEVFMILPALAAFYTLLRYSQRGRMLDISLAGAFGALSLIVKTVALPQVLVFAGLLLFVRPQEDQARSRLLRLALFAVPGIVLLAAVCLYFAARGAWDEFFYWNVTFILGKYKAQANEGVSLAGTLREIAPELLVPALVTTLGLARLGAAGRRPEIFATALLLPATLVGVLLPGKNFPHYFIQLLPMMALIGGFALDQLWSARRAILIPTSLVLTAALGLFVSADFPLYAWYTPQQVSALKYSPIFVETEELSKILRARTHPDDYIFQWGFEPEVYFLADRRPSVRYLASLLVGLDRAPERARRELAEGLAARPPRYMVIDPVELSAPGTDEVIAALRQRYVLEGQFGRFVVFRLKTGAGSDVSGPRSQPGSTRG
jgi:4-amino-4-deoxy-L-arabinose transferase-like glycosyltransferase